MTQNEVFNEIPCLDCSCGQRDRVLHILGMLYLYLERGDKPRIPTKNELLSGCCQRMDQQTTITFLVNSERETALEIEHPR
jgi:hypothetical protein